MFSLVLDVWLRLHSNHRFAATSAITRPWQALIQSGTYLCVVPSWRPRNADFVAHQAQHAVWQSNSTEHAMDQLLHHPASIGIQRMACDCEHLTQPHDLVAVSQVPHNSTCMTTGSCSVPCAPPGVHDMLGIELCNPSSKCACVAPRHRCHPRCC